MSVSTDVMVAHDIFYSNLMEWFFIQAKQFLSSSLVVTLLMKIYIINEL